MKKRTLVLFAIIFLLGSSLRLYKLDKFPPSLFGDEVDVGYQAYSILKTGKDYLGQKWPISFHSIADWRTPLFLYSDVPFIALFGLNEWGVRLPAAIFGILTLPFFFLLIRKLFKKDEPALWGTFFLSISMWHLQYSRAAFEVTQMLLLIVAGLYFFLKGLERWPYLILSAVFLALTPYSYNTAKFFLPLLLIIILFSFWEEIKRIPLKRLALAGIIFTLICLPMVKDIFSGQGGSRFSILSIFTDPTTIPQIGFDRQVDMSLKMGETVVGTKPSLTSRIFHNKFLYWGISLLKNYFKVFSTDFLFTFGDINFRHSIQGGFGELYWFDAVFLLLGLFFLALVKDKKIKRFIFSWLLLAPVPAILTRDGGNHATRLILMLPPLLILISFGAYSFLEQLKKSNQKNYIYILLFTFYFLHFTLYLHRYYVHYPLESQEWWHFGYKEMGKFVKENEDKFDYIVFSDRDQPPLIFTLFWLGIDPKIIQEGKLEWIKINEAITADNLSKTKYYFGHVLQTKIKEYWPGGTLNPKILYLAPGSEVELDFREHNVPSTIKLLGTVYYPNNSVAKYFLTGN